MKSHRVYNTQFVPFLKALLLVLAFVCVQVADAHHKPEHIAETDELLCTDVHGLSAGTITAYRWAGSHITHPIQNTPFPSLSETSSQYRPQCGRAPPY
ncbi:hypothetical protein [Marinibactrum halimedae]|uniref:hypothetical protein n=1 Tax=Marinibactrum halimedae TaxID=1444977 RepID=UPI001E340FDB|nr:hypothetical protein [Marinibactrum halimedae]MCD9459322.1 hypothetical protein [Marinibactrum halimedae]